MGSVAQSLKKSTNAMRPVILLTTLCLGLASSSPVGEQSRAFDKLVEAQENAKKLGATSKIAQIPFNVEERNDDYRVVQLPASMWVCTNTTIAIDEDPYDNWRQVHGTAIAALGANQDTVTSKMFKSLFQYIIGVNTKSAEIKMTAPVTNRVVDDDEAGTRLTEMCFWLGSAYNYQNLPPSPLSEDVYIQNRDPTTYFVRRFSGWALSNTDWESQLEDLMVSLTRPPFSPSVSTVPSTTVPTAGTKFGFQRKLASLLYSLKSKRKKPKTLTTWSWKKLRNTSCVGMERRDGLAPRWTTSTQAWTQ